MRHLMPLGPVALPHAFAAMGTIPDTSDSHFGGRPYEALFTGYFLDLAAARQYVMMYAAEGGPRGGWALRGHADEQPYSSKALAQRLVDAGLVEALAGFLGGQCSADVPAVIQTVPPNQAINQVCLQQQSSALLRMLTRVQRGPRARPRLRCTWHDCVHLVAARIPHLLSYFSLPAADLTLHLASMIFIYLLLHLPS